MRRLTGTRGSVLILMPVAVLIVLLLGAIAVDLTVVHLRQQQAVDAAASAANDAVTLGLDESALRAGRGYRLDPERVRRAVDESLADQGLGDDLVDPPIVTEPTPHSVRVELTLRANYLFARSIPGAPRSTTVRGTATADAEEG
jgi:Flp pilus assembly protein TadG